MEKQELYEKIWESLFALRGCDTLFDVSSESKEQRIHICRDCENYNPENSSCTLNLGSINHITRSVMEKCPVDKWTYDKTSFTETLDSILT